MRQFPVDCDDETLRQAVVDWSELLAQEKYGEALAMFLPDPRHKWTPALLEECIANYGEPRQAFDSGEYLKVTSIHEQPDSVAFIRRAIEINRVHSENIESDAYVGMIHYDKVPLDGIPSDLTARFSIKQLPTLENDLPAITLEFIDIHVM